jgi:hypothetical protein
MASKSFDLISPLPRLECVRRLREMTDRVWKVFGGKPVIGYVGESSLRLSKRIMGGNSFQDCLHATLVEEPDQTRLRCRVGMHPLVSAFIVVWFGGVLLMGGAMSAEIIADWLAAHDPIPPGRWLGIAVPLLMLGMGVAVVKIGKHLARDERVFLLDFLRRTIDAREA